MGSQHQQYSNVRVLARVRPPLSHEYQFDHAAETPSATQIRLQNTKQSYESDYDRVLPETSSQEMVYAQVKDCVPSLLQGYNNTVLAYGQTGTGKTYTMIGDQSMTLAEACSAPSSVSGHGILPRAVYDLFAELDRRKAAAASSQQQYDVKVVCSYLEIYNDRLYDLLQPYKKASSRDPLRIQMGKTSLEVREDPVAGTHVPNLLYVDVQNCRQVLQLVATGNNNRATAHTDMNRHSSRSHAILQLWLEQRPSAATAAANSRPGTAADVVVRSKMNFVDLAGSERWGKAHTESETRTLINELTSINNSLSALALVVAALTDKTAKHVPYRSSRLTHLLQDSLGGNCNTTLLVTVAPCVDAFDDSMAALKFADRARNISNKAVVNSMHDTETILALKEREIQRLRALLATYTSGSAAGAAIQSQWQQWTSESVPGQDAPLLPSTQPSTPASSTTSASGHHTTQHSPNLSPTNSVHSSSRQPSHLGTSSTSRDDPISDIPERIDAGGATADAAADAVAVRAQLESELAAMRAALLLERNMRSVLEGQLQEATAAAQAEREAAAAAAAAAQQEAAAAARNSSAAANTQLSSTASAGGLQAGIDRVSAADQMARTGRSSLLLHNSAGGAAAEQHQTASVNAAWPALTSLPGQLQRQPLYNQSSPKLSQTQHAQKQSPKKQQGASWDDHWQGSAEQRIKGAYALQPHKHQQQHKQQGSNTGNRSNTSSPVPSSPKADRAKSLTVRASNKGLPAKPGPNEVLRSSWSEAYGASGGHRGKWPKPGGADNRAGSSSEALSTSAAGFHTARPTAGGLLAEPNRGRHSPTVTAGAVGALHMPQRSVSPVRPLGKSAAAGLNSKAVQRYAAVDIEPIGAGILPILSGSSPSTIKPQNSTLQHASSNKQQQTTASLLPERQTVAIGPVAQQQQQLPAKQGWGRSWLMQQAQLQAQSTAAAEAAASTSLGAPSVAQQDANTGSAVLPTPAASEASSAQQPKQRPASSSSKNSAGQHDIQAHVDSGVNQCPASGRRSAQQRADSSQRAVAAAQQRQDSIQSSERQGRDSSVEGHHHSKQPSVSGLTSSDAAVERPYSGNQTDASAHTVANSSTHDTKGQQSQSGGSNGKLSISGYAPAEDQDLDATRSNSAESAEQGVVHENGGPNTAGSYNDVRPAAIASVPPAEDQQQVQRHELQKNLKVQEQEAVHQQAAQNKQLHLEEQRREESKQAQILEDLDMAQNEALAAADECLMLMSKAVQGAKRSKSKNL